MLAIAGYFFDQILLPLSKSSTIALAASAIIVAVRDQLLKEEPDRSRRLKTVIEISVVAKIIALI